MAAFARIGFCLLMSKTFRPWTIDQPLLLPPSVQDFVGEDHLARFILALVLEHLDLGEIEAAYASERGQPPFDPAMMTALLLYGYCHGVYSSRRIAKATRERVDFMSIVGLDPPDFRTVSDFRKRHLKALAGLFGQVLKLCEQAGFVKLGHVALDGTKIKANASKHKAMSYERMEKRAAELEAEVERWLSAAAAADAEEDRAFGRDKSGAELPKWVADKKKRAEKIRAAKAELEAEAKAAAAAKAKAQAEAEERRQAEGRKKPGKPAAPPSEEPDPKAQKNFTDPESRIMKTKDGFIQGYNAQAAVDATAQVIVAHGLDAKQSDQHQLAPIADAIEANLGKKPTQLSADAGYCSDANLAAMEEREIDAYIAPGRAKHAGEGEGGGARVAAMRERIKAGGHSSPYRLRKQLPEPVFGQIKQARGFRQFLLRGVEKVANEWGLVCLAHNILKLAQGRTPSLAAPQPAELRHLGNGATNDGRKASTLTSNRMRKFAASGSPTGLSGSNPISPGLSRQAPRRENRPVRGAYCRLLQYFGAQRQCGALASIEIWREGLHDDAAPSTRGRKGPHPARPGTPASTWSRSATPARRPQ